MKPLYIFIIFLLVAFGSKNASAQGREIKETFNADTRSVEVGDSCFIRAFFGSSYPIIKEMALVCDSIYAFLKQNPTIHIAIIVHSDPRPIPMGNDVITTYRANSLKNCILKRGDIDSNRIVAIGMGDSQLMIVTKEIHKQYKFLPVGQVLDMEFCRTISDFQKREIALGFNRRTVVKIIAK